MADVKDQANRIGGTNYREAVEHLHALEKIADYNVGVGMYWSSEVVFRRRVARVHEILTVVRKAQAVQPYPTTITTDGAPGLTANPKRYRVNPDRWELE